MTEHTMKIVVERHYAYEYSAIDADSYDGPGSPMGLGNSGDEAVADLLDQLEERGLRPVGDVVAPIVARATPK